AIEASGVTWMDKECPEQYAPQPRQSIARHGGHKIGKRAPMIDRVTVCAPIPQNTLERGAGIPCLCVSRTMHPCTHSRLLRTSCPSPFGVKNLLRSARSMALLRGSTIGDGMAWQLRGSGDVTTRGARGEKRMSDEACGHAGM